MGDKRRGLVHHIEVYVSDLARSLAFWEWFLGELGYKEYQVWDEGRSFKLGETYIVFVQTEERFLDIEYHRCRTGLNHLAFFADSPQDVDNMTEKLKAKNINILYEDRHPYASGEDSYSVFFEDPDRIKVEFTS
jgi:catechol 2,3-dioxygenase-like lactoylglutathione lyase family enzyme